MKKLSMAVVLVVLFIGFGSASAEIASYLAPPVVYVGRPWNVNVFYVADPELCNPGPDNCPGGWANVVYSGDFGAGSSAGSDVCFGTMGGYEPLAPRRRVSVQHAGHKSPDHQRHFLCSALLLYMQRGGRPVVGYVDWDGHRAAAAAAGSFSTNAQQPS